MKKTFVWIVYFLVCGAVIAAAIKAGSHHKNCNDCGWAYTFNHP
ncbi:MAG TPA: hypothetical protein VF487_00185 [Chitinophagaceae bacterium]